MAREEWRQQEQNHLRDKQQLGQQLHDKDKQYTQLIRDIKLKQMEQVRANLGITNLTHKEPHKNWYMVKKKLVGSV